MIPLSPAALPLAALGLAALAAGAAAWSRRGGTRLLREAATAVGISAVGLLGAVGAWTLGRSAQASALRNLAGLLVFLTPAVAAAALTARHRLPLVRTLLAGWLVAAGLFAWLLLSLRGPGGGWLLSSVALATSAAILALSGGLCAAAWTRRSVAHALALAAAGVAVAGVAASCAPPGERGLLVLEIRDAATGAPVPGRVELLDAAGRAWIPPDALEIAGDCGMLPFHNWIPALAAPQVALRRRRSVVDPYRETEQFYLDGRGEISLSAGEYRLRATRGPEYRVAEDRVAIAGSGTATVLLAPERWIDLPAEGWFGADDHLHIPRPAPSADDTIARWMAAEGLHVANLLQMGLARDVHITPQYGFGAPGAHRHDSTLLLSGQENPRTHVLGHSIVLGAPRWIDRPADYLLYPEVWAEARSLGALNGYAHFGLGGAEKGLALWGRTGLLDFLEVGNFGFGLYDRWYEALNLGLRLTPTGGSDFPCVPSLPGRDRFYAHLGGPFELEAWLDAIRRGRTFVTNGPAIELRVASRGGEATVGDEVRLEGPETVRVWGRVRFDPDRDRVDRLELVDRGEVVHVVAGSGSEGELVLEVERPVEKTSWLALRAGGVKPGEVRPRGIELLRQAVNHPPPRPDAPTEPLALPGARHAPVSAAHTAAVWIVVEGSEPLRSQPAGRAAAAAWSSRLADLEHWLSEGELAAVAGYPGRGDGVPEGLLRAHREALLEAAEQARLRLRSP